MAIDNNSIITDIETQLESARQNLLDLTMRNKLLNFRPSKLRTIRIIDEIPAEIYDILVIQEKSMEFLCKSDNIEITSNDVSIAEDEIANGDHDNTGISEEERSRLWKLPSIDKELAKNYWKLGKKIVLDYQ